MQEGGEEKEEGEWNAHRAACATCLSSHAREGAISERKARCWPCRTCAAAPTRLAHMAGCVRCSPSHVDCSAVATQKKGTLTSETCANLALVSHTSAGCPSALSTGAVLKAAAALKTSATESTTRQRAKWRWFSSLALPAP
eukprot:3277078-Pleurochrysis_carterae.AAC.5